MSIPQSLTSWTGTTGDVRNFVYSTVNPSKTSTLGSIVSSAVAAISTETDPGAIKQLVLTAQGAKASIDIASAAQVTATATDSTVIESANAVLLDSSLVLKYIYDENNNYGYNLTWPPQIIFAAIFGLTLLYTILMLWKSRYHWYNVAFICGLGLELAGFICRIMSIHDPSDTNLFIGQIIGLTIAPAFIMGGIYFLFAQHVVIHGRQFSSLKPMWYSYFFIACDVLSLVIQSIGGAMASIASNQKKDSRPGSYTTLGGIAFQVISMTIFLYFWFESMWRIYFKHKVTNSSTELINKGSFLNFVRFLCNAKCTREAKRELEAYYNPNFRSIRQRKLFPWYALAITLSSIFIYIRCIYRVVELAQGYDGWLITREWPVIVLDALMVALAVLIFVPFHPVFVLGQENLVKVATIKKNLDEGQGASQAISSANSSIEEKA